MAEPDEIAVLLNVSGDPWQDWRRAPAPLERPRATGCPWGRHTGRRNRITAAESDDYRWRQDIGRFGQFS